MDLESVSKYRSCTNFWKFSEVIPIYKNNRKPDNCASNRSVCLTSYISKTLGKKNPHQAAFIPTIQIVKDWYRRKFTQLVFKLPYGTMFFGKIRRIKICKLNCGQRHPSRQNPRPTLIYFVYQQCV